MVVEGTIIQRYETIAIVAWGDNSGAVKIDKPFKEGDIVKISLDEKNQPINIWKEAWDGDQDQES